MENWFFIRFSSLCIFSFDLTTYARSFCTNIYIDTQNIFSLSIYIHNIYSSFLYINIYMYTTYIPPFYIYIYTHNMSTYILPFYSQNIWHTLPVMERESCTFPSDKTNWKKKPPERSFFFRGGDHLRGSGIWGITFWYNYFSSCQHLGRAFSQLKPFYIGSICFSSNIST